MNEREDCIFCRADAYQREDGEWECDFGHVYPPRPAPPDPEAVLRALWECGVASGMDTDGDAGPEAMIAGMGEAAFASAMVEQVRQLRRDYDEANATVELSRSARRMRP